MSLGQARLIEAMMATAIIVVLAALVPALFKSPTTTFRSEVQVDVESYAYDVLYSVYSNPQFLNYVSSGNWWSLRSLMNTVVGPQFNWLLCIVPIPYALNITASMTDKYVKVPLQLILTGTGSYAEVSIPLRQINYALPPGYGINTTVPMANVFMASSDNRPVSWWLMSYDNNTGIATVWLNSTSSSLSMYISRSGARPYNPLNNSYCKLPYCSPYGGLSRFMGTALGLGYVNGPSVFPSYNALDCKSPIMITTSPYTNPGIVTCSAKGISVQNQQAVLGIHSGLIGQLLTAVPGSSLTVAFNVGITVTRGNTVLYSVTVPIRVIMTYNQDGTEVINSTVVSNYVYLYLIRGGFSVNYTATANRFNVNYRVVIHDYLSDRDFIFSGTRYVGGVNQPWNLTMSLGLSITQSTPRNNAILYNTTTLIYDVWLAPAPSVSLVNPVSTSYSCTNNVVPITYSYRFPTISFTPTAEAYTVIQLPNGTYYLLIIALQSLSHG